MHVRKVSSKISLCIIHRLIRDNAFRFYDIFRFIKSLLSKNAAYAEGVVPLMIFYYIVVITNSANPTHFCIMYIYILIIVIFLSYEIIIVIVIKITLIIVFFIMLVIFGLINRFI